MLTKQFRFQGLGSVRAAMNHGASVRMGLFTIKILLRSHRQHPRAAVIVSRKTAKKATARNKIRRRIYAALHDHWKIVSVPLDIVIIVHDSRVADLAYHDLDVLVARALQSALKLSSKNDATISSHKRMLK